MSDKHNVFKKERHDYISEHGSNGIRAIRLKRSFNGPVSAGDVEPQRETLKLLPSERKKAGRPKKQTSLDLGCYVASDKTQAKLDKLMAEARASSKFVFDPVYVTQPQKGSVYVYPGIGPVKCEGLDSMEVAGFKVKVFSFREIGMTGSSVMRVLENKIEEKRIRELAPEKVLDDLIRKLNKGAGAIAGFPRQPNHQKAVFEKARHSSDLSDMLRLLNHAFRDKKKVIDYTSLEMTFANAAVKQIAEEYAFVKGVPFDDAANLLKRAVGMPTLKQLKDCRDGRGRRYDLS
jgi:RNA polymerase-interacting CarD/CdnL/TRCF family regulator